MRALKQSLPAVAPDVSITPPEREREGPNDGQERCRTTTTGAPRNSAGVGTTNTTRKSFRAKIEQLVTELPADSPVAAFERACAFDSTGQFKQLIN